MGCSEGRRIAEMYLGYPRFVNQIRTLGASDLISENAE
jgi:hypothetical protein